MYRSQRIGSRHWLCAMLILGCSVTKGNDDGAFGADAESCDTNAGRRETDTATGGHTAGSGGSGSGGTPSSGGSLGNESAGGGAGGLASTGGTPGAGAGGSTGGANGPGASGRSDGQGGSAGGGGAFVAERGLILYYDFDETVGSVVHDRSGSGRDGVVRGNVAWLSAGHARGALKLAGGKGDTADPQYVEMPVGTLNSLNEATVSAWIRWDGGPSWQRVFDFGSDLEHCFFYSPDGNGAGRAMVRTIAGSNNADLFMTARPLLGIWMHLAISWSPATLAVYMDGELVESAPSAPFVSAPGVSPGSLGLTPRNFIGRSQASVDPYFAGSIDEFRVYDRALRKEEIVALRDAQVTH